MGTNLALVKHDLSQKMGSFLWSFLFPTFIFLSQRCNYISSHGEEIFHFHVFRLTFSCVFHFYFLLFLSVRHHSTRIEILSYLVSFCPPKSITNSFSQFNFLSFHGTFCLVEKHNLISCFMISFTHPVEFFLLTVF